MKFFDHAYITVQSGKGGNGCTSARRESGVPYGGPNGGNGGRGGHLYINVDPNLNTLLPFKYIKNYKAPDGERGQSRDKYGKNAEDLTISVPLGTVIKDQATGHVLFVADQIGISHLLLKGGDGGAGNMHFKNSILQYPDFCLNGEPGQYLELELELQLIADVGLIGTPSVGKSSIINLVSNAKAQVAEYHFTTITPNLGSVRYDGIDRNVIDIPGIIEGASDGKGLGIEFLRHILKCSIFNFVLDLGRWDEGIQEFGTLWTEILTYCRSRFAHEYNTTPDEITFHLETENNVLLLIISQNNIIITRKVIMRTVNKSDETEDNEIRQEYLEHLLAHIHNTLSPLYEGQESAIKALLTHNILRTSTYLHEGTDQLIMRWKQLIEIYHHSSQIHWFTHSVIDIHRPNGVVLLETKSVTEIDGYLDAKPYLLEGEDNSFDLVEDDEHNILEGEEIDTQESDEDSEDAGRETWEDDDNNEIFGDGQGDDEVFYDHWDPTIAEDKIIHKDVVGAVVYDTSSDTYIVVEQLGTDRRKFMGGEIEDGETPKQAILREIKEELGFDTVEHIEELDTIQAKYYHPSKKEYIQGAATCFYVEVDGTTQGFISPEEEQIQTLHYLARDQVADWITISWHQYFWTLYLDQLDDEDSDTSDTAPTTVRIRSVYEPDIARIVYMMQRGNDQAEQRFWKYMQKSGAITWLRNHKVKHGDILRFDHPYSGIEERQIIFEI